MRFCLFAKLRMIFLVGLLPGIAAGQDLVQLARSGELQALISVLPEGSEPDPETLGRPLYFASQRGHGDVVSYLLSLGADPDSATNFDTSLGIAARNNSTGIVETLLVAGANPNLRGGEDGRMPLHQAAERGALEAARLLLKNGADVNALALRSGWPAIHFAASKDQSEMVAYLRGMGAGPNPVEALKPEELEAADSEQGRLIAIECAGCHNMEEGATEWHQFPAPNLFGVVERAKASVEGFPYSDAMRTQTGRWTVEELNSFLADPFNVVPGTSMGRGAQPDRAARAAIISHLSSLEP